MFTKQLAGAAQSPSDRRPPVSMVKAEKPEMRESRTPSEKPKRVSTTSREREQIAARAAKEATDDDVRVTCTICGMDMKTEDRQVELKSG